ncbi:LysM peptidoglycan-binding domain-containing protein [Prescottella agglutinans]|uniref:LysM peptidoglycan-binding domain-containing protein n=1 Tax=Prescottella agglutinans TaxID=1644129 RepID=A0A3S3BEW2_9NOCA|nr:LysM peptidoglycan-binding domain-containing protein [Prescottella agglutinans]RVW09691.1 LysM peptidoglycan-binding domain-containing protein [Prescottella agglutinans]
MGMALSGNGSTGVIGERGAARRIRPTRITRGDSVGPRAGTVRYDFVPRHGSRGSRVSRAATPSHDQRPPRSRLAAGIGNVAAAAVVTIGAVMGLGALANLTAGSGAMPTETAAVRVHGGETLSDVAARVAPEAPVGQVVDRIMELNEMSSAAVRTGQTLLAPVSLGR